MKIQLTALIVEQLRTVGVMMAAGVFVESLWQIRCFLLKRFHRRTGSGSGQSGHVRHSRLSLRRAATRQTTFAAVFARAAIETHFWMAATLVVSFFLYYCAWGKLSVHAAVGFFTGLLLWKKMCCDIIKTWVKTDEAQNLKITARSSTWQKHGSGDKNEDAPKKKKKKKKNGAKNSRTPGANGRSAEAGSAEE